MPSALVKKFAERSGKSVDTVERYWDEAKASAKEAGLKKKQPGFWAYVNAIVQRRLGLNESVTFVEFLSIQEDNLKVDKDN